ncbi:MAG: type II toxin-antitoxin system VapC family toxin [Actinomycetota bacterium]
MGAVLKGILDTSVVIAQNVSELPDESTISVATLAELHFGVLVGKTAEIRQKRLRRLAEIESRVDPLPVDAAVARSYGALAQTVVQAGRKPRARVMDILIAATASAHDLPLYTHNRDDFKVFEDFIEIKMV